MMTYVYAFLFCGFVCMIAQLILDNTKLTPGHVTSIFVVVGALLDVAGIYDKIVLYAGAGALIPITSFGHLLIHRGKRHPEGYGPAGVRLLRVHQDRPAPAGVRHTVHVLLRHKAAAG